MPYKKALLWLSLIFLAIKLPAATPTLDIYWNDVEGGGGTLIVTPAGESVLIDSGWPTGSAERIYHTATNAGVSKIDYLVTTHFHIDHFGGAAELSKLIPIGVVFDNGYPAKFDDGTPADAAAAYKDFKTSSRKVIRPGEYIPLRQAKNTARLTLRCVAARQQIVHSTARSSFNKSCAGSPQMPVDTSDNANSIVLVLEFGGFKFFDGGDLTWNKEADLVCPNNSIGRVDVFQVNHHGLDISNNPLLLQSLSPTVTVMNNGANKGGAKATLEHLRATPSIQTMYQVHRDLRGGKEFNTDNKYIANLDEKCAGNIIQCSVASQGRNYTMSIPETHFSQQYKTIARPMGFILH